MADSDQSLYNLRYNQIDQGLEGFGGGSPMWTPLVLATGSGINRLTGDVTAGPGSGSQAATVVSVGGSSASSVHTSQLLTAAATPTSVINTLVLRDGSGNFVANKIEAAAGFMTVLGETYSFNDPNWTVGLDSGAFTNTYNTSHALMIGVGGSPTSGFSMGNTGGTSSLEIDGFGIVHVIDQLYVNKATVSGVFSAAGTGTITPDATQGNTLEIAVSGALTINGPTGALDGQKLTIRILNDSSDAVTLSTGAGNFRFGTDIPSYTNSVSLTDYIGAIWNNTAGVWDVVSIIQGF